MNSKRIAYLKVSPLELFKTSPTLLLFMFDAPSKFYTQGSVVSYSYSASILTSDGNGLVKEHFTMSWSLITNLGKY